MSRSEFVRKLFSMSDELNKLVDAYAEESLSVKAEDIEWINEVANEFSDMANSYDRS